MSHVLASVLFNIVNMCVLVSHCSPVLHEVGNYITYVARHVTQFVNVDSKILVLFGEELF